MTEHDDKLFLGAETAESADERALPKARTDVEVAEQVYYGKPCYVLKDPTSLRYYRFRPPEYTIYKMLDGKQREKDSGQFFPVEQIRIILDKNPPGL